MRSPRVVLAWPLTWISEALLLLSILLHGPSSACHHWIAELLWRLNLRWMRVAIFCPDLLLVFLCTADEVTELCYLKWEIFRLKFVFVLFYFIHIVLVQELLFQRPELKIGCNIIKHILVEKAQDFPCFEDLDHVLESMIFVRILRLVLALFHEMHDVIEVAPKFIQVISLYLLCDVVHDL